MQILYLVFSILGVGFFLFSALTGHDHDFSDGFDMHGVFDFGHDFDLNHDGDVNVDGDSPGVFSLRTISAFIGAFGMAGVLTQYLDKPLWFQLTWGFIAGFLLMFAVYGLFKVFYKQQSNSITDSSDLKGSLGNVTVGSGSQGIAECRVGNNCYTCRSNNEKPLVLGQTVKVVETLPGMLIVELI